MHEYINWHNRETVYQLIAYMRVLNFYSAFKLKQIYINFGSTTAADPLRTIYFF